MARFMDELMAEKISYGGLVASRINAYRHALSCLLSRHDCPSRQAAERGADWFAFGPRAVVLSDDEIAYRQSVGLVMDPATGEPVTA